MSARPAPPERRFASAELRALRPWALAFEVMPEEQIRLIGAALEAIAPLVETAERERRAGQVELDSFDDVVARGPIERLILAEFAWLQAAPREFARRIAENEALRRRPLYEDRVDDRAILLMLDSGPAMLGRRRLAALGALFALGTAARRRGVRLIWSASGFSRAPLWLDGVDRRGLARFVHQTAAADWTEAEMRARLEAAPAPEAGCVLWLVGAADAPAPDLEAAYRLEIDEIWPERSAAPALARPHHLRATLIGGEGLRREATIPTPPERLAADMLRAPFRAPDHPAPASGPGWAPRRISLETEGGAMLIRLDDALLLRGPGRRTLRIRLPEGGEPLGVRALGPARCVVVWREGGALGRAFIDASTRTPDIAVAPLSADHPLLAGQVAADAAPPALRFGRGASPAVAAPDGSIHRVQGLDEWAAEGLDATPHPAVASLRIEAWAQGSILARSADHPERGPALYRLRSGARRGLAVGAARPIAPPVRQCLPVGETGGALIADAQGVVWIPGAAPGGGGPAAQPDLPRETILLGVEPGGHESIGHAGSLPPIEARRWGAVVWRPEEGLTDLRYADGAWRSWSSRAPTPSGRLRAMVRSGKLFYAAVDADGEAPGEGVRILQFRRGDAAATPSASAAWMTGAACVQL